jgi:hypothetical protein
MLPWGVKGSRGSSMMIERCTTASKECSKVAGAADSTQDLAASSTISNPIGRHSHRSTGPQWATRIRANKVWPVTLTQCLKQN